MLVGSFVIDTLAEMFLELIDVAVYAILTSMYNIFSAICKIDLFNTASDSAEMSIYNEFAARIYTIIGIVMVFIFAYRLILYILDPDGKYAVKSGGTAAEMVKRTVFSVVLVIVAPLIFKYMGLFQKHVVANGTIPSIILGTNGGDSRYISDGKQVSMITLMSFFHPNDMTYNDFFTGADANQYDNKYDYCEMAITKVDKLKNCPDQDVCKAWRTEMYNWCTAGAYFSPAKLQLNDTIGKGIRDTWFNPGTSVTYLWVLCTIGGGLVIYFIVCYSISIGTRAIKLAALQLIAPFPIFMRIFDESKYFTPWFDEIKKTYLELFLRIAVIFFCVYVCTIIPRLIAAVIF